MRRARNGDNRIVSRTFRDGYAFDRNGIATYRLAGRSQSTGLRWPEPEDDERRKAIAEGLDQWLAAVRIGETPTASTEGHPTTIKALVLAYIDAHPHLTPPVRRIIAAAVDTYATPDIRLESRAIVRRIMQIHADPTITRERKAKDGTTRTVTMTLARATVTKRYDYLRTILRWGWRRDWLDEDPTARVEAPKRTESRARAFAFTDDELARIERWFATRSESDNRMASVRESLKRGRPEKWIPVWRLMLYTGLRAGELIALEWTDVSDDAMAITGKRERWDEPKRRGFPVAAFPEVRAALDELRALAAEVGGPASRYVVPWCRSVQSLGNALRDCLRDLGIAGSVKTFRVTSGVRWARMGLSERTIADLRGHTREVSVTYYRPEQMATDIAGRIALERPAGLRSRRG